MYDAIKYLKKELNVRLTEDGFFYSIFESDKYRVKLIFRDRTFRRNSYQIYINDYYVKFTKWKDLYKIVDNFKNN
jgi:hypothetical protein|nr:MAG TPA: hypothetical protein [Caudoviricetes sp.]